MKNLQRPALLLVLLIALLLQACQTVGNRAGETRVDGATLYTNHCAACHGVRGWGGVGVPLALADFLKYSSDEYLAMTIRVGRPGRVMPSFSYLKESEVQAIVRHIRDWGPKSPPYIDKVVAGDPAKGGLLFDEYCAHCHGKEAEGGAGTGVSFSRPRHMMIIPPALNNSGFLLSATDEMIKHTITFGRAGTPMKSFRRKGLRRDDINNLVAYIRSFQRQLPPEAGVIIDSTSPVLSVESPYSMDVTIERIKRILADNGHVMIDDWPADRKMADRDQVFFVIKDIYFGNLDAINGPLSLDPRMGLFLPARITLMQQMEGKVKVMMPNPEQYSAIFNNSSLNKMSRIMYEQYQAMLSEVVK
ncbi:MAG: c-type cytochrome [Candidatus Polarisedimenticolaceae bacterium]|nr:c-type cytochrome [Candidatus Polarisedimenticolaceae bacterium]